MSMRTVWQYARNVLGNTSLSRHISRSAPLRFENLESRQLLSVTPPTVSEVAVASTEWSSGFYDYLAPALPATQATQGYPIPTGSTAQTKALPWENIDQLQIAFSEDVHVDAADFSVSGINNTAYSVDSFHYDAQSHVATLTFANSLPLDQLLIDLDADGIDPVTDLDGNILDGEWVNNVTIGASGNGTAGGDFEFRFNVVPGDVDQNTYVNYYDYIFTRAREGQDTTGANYTPLHDINGSGLIDTTDWLHVLGHLGNLLPAGQPAGVTNDAPTTVGLDRVELHDPAVDEAISLFAAFEDAEDMDNQLTFSVTGNTDPSLLDVLTINSSTGELSVSAANNASGRTTVTVEAVDSQGLKTETDFAIDVDRINLPPHIHDFHASQHPGNTWLFTGYVTDPDDDVDGWIVEFTGAIQTRATVDENGYFEFALILDENVSGFVWAITEDPWGLESNEPAVHVSLT